MLIDRLPKDQINMVLNQPNCDIEPSFLGFTDIYEHLSKIIPKHFTVIDLGCAYNPQCFYFTEHKLYVAVDQCKCLKFKSKNCIIYNEGIVEFIKEDLYRYNLHNVFAICSYVLPGNDEVNKLVRDTFSNLFIHYPYPESNPLNDYHDRMYKYWN